MSEHDSVAATIDGSSTPRPTESLITLELDGELLILDPRTDRMHQLDRLGTIIWSVLDGAATVDALVDDLADAFDTPADVVEGDLVALLDKLGEFGLLEGTEPHEHLLVGSKASITDPRDGLWRPSYLTDPPAP